ncbi:metalloprotease [Coemansia aciculifera]|uniref:Metalloprotease n=1 Tax=Coemansia aciculifera TaxID=417176 RepID=A0A9W8IMS1_9FUNG|nr:metalloprotease [Coemansia aciculifera]
MVGTLDDDPALADIPTYVLAKYTSTGSRFRCWHFEHPMHGYFIEAVKAMLILALVCPNFDCFVPLPKEREPIMKLLEETIATDGFEKYPADWETNFESKLTVESSLPYEEYTGPIEKSGNDQRQYRLVRLPNNLTALCVQDADTKVAAASLSVNVGSSANPIELQGLAHFLEHMLFLGTEKYPKEGEYDAYLSKNSGKYNAYTSFIETNYYFHIFNDALEGALDRFAQFFISPLFNADCVDRELKAVDSEYKGNLQSDPRRTYQLVARTANSTHPFSWFPTGNTGSLKGAAEELGLDLREELIKFYHKYYSADIMRLVVVGNHSLDVLSEWVTSKFSAIKSKGITKPMINEHPIDKTVLGKVVHYKTVCEMYELKLQFALPELKSTYGAKPFAFINALISHREAGSIYSLLSKNGWATAISAYSSGMCDDGFGTYTIDIAATPEGLENYEAIVNIIFGYIKMLVESGPQEWYYQELAQISKAKFDFKDKEEAENYARSLSSCGHSQYVPPHEILSHGSLFTGFNADLISKGLRYLNPGNYRLFIGAQEHKAVECKLEEKHYSILHHVADLPLHMISDVKCSRSVAKMLHLPGRNKFLPENLSVTKPATPTDTPALEPVLLRKNDKFEVWFKQDDQFFTPHGHIGIAISSESVDSSPVNHLLSTLLCELVSAELQEQLFSALLANSNFSIGHGMGSITVGVSGFSSGLPLLLKTVLQKLKTFKVDAQQFSIYLAKVERNLQSKRQDNPMQCLYKLLNAVNAVPGFDQDMLEEALKGITLDGLQAHIESLFSKAYVKMLVSGNYTQEVALDTSNQVFDILQHQPVPEFLINTHRTLNIESGYYIQNVPISDQKCLNSAAVCVFYCGSVDDTRDAVTLRVLRHLVHSACFAQLRTSEQLGYRVGARLDYNKSGKEMLMIVLEGESNPVYVTRRINEFIRQYRQKLQELTAEEFESSVQSLISLMQEKLKSIDDEFDRLWAHINSNKYKFDALDKDVEHLKQLSKNDLLAFWDKYMSEDTAQGYTRLDMQMWSTKIWQPTADEFEMYPSTMLALYGCLRSAGHTGLTIADVQSFVSSADASSSIESLLAELSELYLSKQAPSVSSETVEVTNTTVSDVEEPRIVFESSSKIATALQMTISAANEAPRFATLSKTNFANIDMKQSPEGIWLINDYTQFKSTQALHGLPIPVRKLNPAIPEPVLTEVEKPAETTDEKPQPSTNKSVDAPRSFSNAYGMISGRLGLWRQAWKKHDQPTTTTSSK